MQIHVMNTFECRWKQKNSEKIYEWAKILYITPEKENLLKKFQKTESVR